MKHSVMKNLILIVLFAFVPLLGQSQSNRLFSEANPLANDTTFFKFDSSPFYEFAKCYDSEKPWLIGDEILYFEVSFDEGKLKLTELKGDYSDMIYQKLTNSLACLEQKEVIQSGFKMILFHRELNAKKRKVYQVILEKFRMTHNLSSKVQVFTFGYKTPIYCGPFQGDQASKNRYLLPTRSYKL